MFTGIVTDIGTILSITKNADRHSLTLIIDSHYSDIKQGESIAVDGACLTATVINNTTFHCDVSHETCHSTIANQYLPGSQVNLERAVSLSDRLSGHIVTGHIDHVANIQLIKKQSAYIELQISNLSPIANRYLINKGNITINGVNLTINNYTKNHISTLCIPHTLAVTNLQKLHTGDPVNIEYDYVAKLIAKQHDHYQQQA